MEPHIYPASFYDQINQGSIRSARIVLGELFDAMEEIPESVIDLGCGEGAWLTVARELGVQEIMGVDGPWVDVTRSMISNTEFVQCDLSQPFITYHSYDLAISLEVAEHLPESSANIFVSSLCGLSDLVLFSAAIPGQGGENHINEQWPSYWAEKFWAHGYGGMDYLRLIIWNDPDVENWYKQNIVLFQKGGGVEPKYIIDAVHRNNWDYHHLGIR